MALLSSSGLNATPSTSSQIGIGNAGAPYVNDVLSKGAAMVTNPAPAYTGQLTAGTSDIQNKAWQGLSNLTLPSTMTSAGGNLLNIGEQAQGVNYNPVGSGFNADQAQQYMNPYLKASLDPQLAEIQRQYDITGTQEQGNATKAGAFGGSREAIMAAENQRNKNTAMNQAIGTGYNTAYNNAQQQFNADQARKIQEAQYGTDTGLKALSAATSANQGAGNIGANEAQYGLQNLNALSAVGNTQQAQNQAGLNALYNQYLDQRTQPWTNLANQANLVKSLGGTNTAGYTAAQSGLQQLAGTTGLVASLTKNLTDAGMPPDKIAAYLKSIGASDLNNGATVDASGNAITPSGPGGTVVNTDNYAGADFGNVANPNTGAPMATGLESPMSFYE